MFWLMLIAGAVVGGGIAHPRTRWLFISKRKELPSKEVKQLPAAASAHLKEWKEIFRSTVISVDGQLTPELESYLMDDDERVTKLLAEARLQTEKDRAELMKKAQEELNEMMREAGEPTKSSRPLLIGASYAEYRDDYNACKSNEERASVNTRWHKKGFRFPSKLRANMLASAGNEYTRDFWRQMFDEQDRG